MRFEFTPDIWVKGAAGGAAMLWSGTTPLVQLLLILMAVDYGTGILAAVINREVSSEVGFRGICRKGIIFLIVMAGSALETAVGAPVDVDAGIAAFYAANELISITENASRADLPVPQLLKDLLVRLNPSADLEPKPRLHDG